MGKESLYTPEEIWQYSVAVRPSWAAFTSNGDAALGYLADRLGEAFNYDELRWAAMQAGRNVRDGQWGRDYALILARLFLESYYALVGLPKQGLSRPTGKSMGTKQDGAKETWKLFHKRPQVDWVKKITAAKLWPDRWALAGRAVTTYYSSDKWQKDRTFFERYFHDHDKETKLWLPSGSLKWLDEKARPPAACPKAPDSVSVLGFYLGTDLLRAGSQVEGKVEASPGSLLVSHPNRHCLYVIEDGRVAALIWGPKLIVEARGVVG